jgi:hypothetical protein
MTRRPLLLSILGILTVSLAACGGDDAAPPMTPATPAVDTAPPVAPTNLVSCAVGRDVKIAWQPNVSDPDFVGFRITRTGAGQTVVLVDEPVDIDRYVDDHPFEGVATYAVMAMDQAGNQSAAAQVIHDYFADCPPRPVIH